MKKELFLLILLVVFTACGQQGEYSNQTITNKTSAVKEEKLLKELGFEVNGQKVTIDINKTAEFMKQIEIEMHSRADKIEHKIKNAEINLTKDLGLEIGEDRVAIDLNKTKDMLQHINILMKDILLDINGTVH